MKKLITFTLLLAAMTFCQIQASTNDYERQIDSLIKRIDTLVQINNQWLEHLDINTSLKNRYKLYPTENIYTLLELDTKTGIIKQVQWGLSSSYEGTFYINSENLNDWGLGYGSGTFELYPTGNMYQFILIDQTNGNKWHVQWGEDDDHRWIRRIY